MLITVSGYKRLCAWKSFSTSSLLLLQWLLVYMHVYSLLLTDICWWLFIYFLNLYSSALTQFRLSSSVQLQFESFGSSTPSLSSPQLRLRFPWLRHTVSWCCIPDNDSIMKKPVKTINYEIKVEDITFHIAAEGSPHIWTKFILYESTLLCFVPLDTQLLITSSKDD